MVTNRDTSLKINFVHFVKFKRWHAFPTKPHFRRRKCDSVSFISYPGHPRLWGNVPCTSVRANEGKEASRQVELGAGHQTLPCLGVLPSSLIQEAWHLSTTLWEPLWMCMYFKTDITQLLPAVQSQAWGRVGAPLWLEEETDSSTRQSGMHELQKRQNTRLSLVPPMFLVMWVLPFLHVNVVSAVVHHIHWQFC